MAVDRTALNAAAQRIASENAKAAANKPAPLNPPFPYKARPFDPFYFDVARDPVVEGFPNGSVPIDSQPQAIPTNG